MKKLLFAAVILALLAPASGSFADTLTYHITPTPADLNDLEHTYYYTWGINRPWASGYQVTAAKLTFDNIYNWDNAANVLYTHLLNTGTLGVTSGWDNEGGGDYFSGKGPLLVTYTNLNTTPRDLFYTFTSTQLTSLNTYAADGRFALGFDPDCHFFNDGVSLDVTVSQPVPEPATMAIMGIGAVAVMLKRRRARSMK